MKKYVALYDLHFGYERRNRHRIMLHDEKALGVALAFIRDFKPDTIIFGGDMLDCGAISHHNHGKPGRVEGLRVLADANEMRKTVLEPLEKTKAQLVYIEGNHEKWLDDLMEEEPGLEGILDLTHLLHFGERWTFIRQGGYFNLGKLTFIHGDQIRGGEYSAKAAVLAYQRNVRYGHYHTLQSYTATSAVDIKVGRVGQSVPCLCRKDPTYLQGSPTRWVQGFNYGYILPNGNFNDYTPIIVDGKAIIEGTLYG